MSSFWPRQAALSLPLLALIPLAACGGHSRSISSSTVNNTVTVVSNLGVTGNNVNGLFTTVTVCVPGTSNCQAIPDVIVDTGSFGLRLLGSALNNLPLPMATASGGGALANCAQFASTFDWGPVASADVQLAGEKASAVPIQIMGQAGFPSPPTSCSSGLTQTDTQALLGANGILGVGVFRYDCDVACTPGQTTIPPIYFSCPNGGGQCTAVLVNLSAQVQNPVPLFPQDNNGVVISLPALTAAGAISVSGTMEIGIDTQSDNALNQVTVLATDGSGGFSTTFQNTSFSGSILDAGSNAIFFLDAATTGLADCPSSSIAPGFYCPAATTGFNATNVAASGGASAPASWIVDNAVTLFNSGNSAFNNLAGPNPSNFDFGLPFFFGRTIFVGVNGGAAGNFTGPFFAY